LIKYLDEGVSVRWASGGGSIKFCAMAKNHFSNSFLRAIQRRTCLYFEISL